MNLFEPYSLSGLRLQSRIVMAPMTRSRAIGNVPNDYSGGAQGCTDYPRA